MEHGQHPQKTISPSSYSLYLPLESPPCSPLWYSLSCFYIFTLYFKPCRYVFLNSIVWRIVWTQILMECLLLGLDAFTPYHGWEIHASWHISFIFITVWVMHSSISLSVICPLGPIISIWICAFISGYTAPLMQGNNYHYKHAAFSDHFNQDTQLIPQSHCELSLLVSPRRVQPKEAQSIWFLLHVPPQFLVTLPAHPVSDPAAKPDCPAFIRLFFSERNQEIQWSQSQLTPLVAHWAACSSSVHSCCHYLCFVSLHPALNLCQWLLGQPNLN